jgi:putative ATPase
MCWRACKPEDLDPLIERGFEAETIDATSDARKRIAEFADGDGRRALNLGRAGGAGRARRGQARRRRRLRELVAQRAGRRFDKGGENYYDQISALHKAVRGSDPTPRSTGWCACWTAASIRATLARRMIRMASEDIGLADPRALGSGHQRAEVYERLGTPEGELALAECVIYLAGRGEVERRLRRVQRGQGLHQEDGTRPVPAAHP